MYEIWNIFFSQRQGLEQISWAQHRKYSHFTQFNCQRFLFRLKQSAENPTSCNLKTTIWISGIGDGNNYSIRIKQNANCSFKMYCYFKYSGSHWTVYAAEMLSVSLDGTWLWNKVLQNCFLIGVDIFHQFLCFRVFILIRSGRF